MIPRLQQTLIAKRLGQFPAVGIVGPRQAGKTTLAKEFSSLYFDLEQESDRVRLDLQWSSLIEVDQLIVLDEAQSWPAIFPRLRGAIDSRRSAKGRFLLLGSVSPSLMKQVSESLAGRLALVELPPLSLAELSSEQADALWRFGGFPDGGALAPESGVYPVWQSSYLRQMSHQDLPAWGLPSKPEQTDRLLRLTAAMHGTPFNASQLGQALGVSYHTVQSHLDYLEGAFLIRRLKPYFARNFPKRLIKAPKLYWRDSGLLHHLLGLSADADPIRQIWVGTSWEGWVIEQILAAREATGETLSAWYFRTSDGLECDLLIESGDVREVIEIKLSSTPSTEDFAKLNKIADLVGATRQVLIGRFPNSLLVETGDRWLVNLPAYLAKFTALPLRPLAKKAGLSRTTLYQRLRDAAGALKENGVLSDETLMKRAEWLKSDLEALALPDFSILPTRWIEPPGSGVRFPLVEYRFGKSDHDLNRADSPVKVPKNVNAMTGKGLDREDLLYLSKVSEIGHSLIPEIWPSLPSLKANLRLPTQHLDTLNEVWWLSRWHGIDRGSVEHEHVARTDDLNLAKKSPSRVDWKFTVLGGQITLHLEVKNRRGSKGSAPFNKGIYLFDGHPEEAFGVSGPDEINVLAITSYHAGWITEQEEASLVSAYLDGLERPVVDAVALAVKGGTGSYEKLFFPVGRNPEKKDLILKAVLRPMDTEDHAFIGVIEFPMSLDEALERIRKS